MKETNKAIIFARISSKEQEDGCSIDAQIERAKKYCESRNLEIIKEYRVVESSLKTRKQFNEMIDFIKKQKICINLVCDKVDRLQRSFKELPMLDSLRIDGKIKLHFRAENVVLHKNSDPSEIMGYQFHVMMANNYINALSYNVKRIFEQMRKEGKVTGMAPIGYLNIKGTGRHSSEIIIDSERACLIRRAFEEYSTGLYSIAEMQKKLANWGLKNKKSNKYLCKSQVDKLLKNKFYAGYATYNGEEYKHIYPIIVPLELFEQCERVRQGKHKNYSNSTKREFIFKGLISCAKCGCTITPEIKKGKYVYLRPNPKNGCNCKQINEKVALNTLESVFKDIKFSKEILEKLVPTLKEKFESETNINKQVLSALKADLTRMEYKISSLTDKFVDESITKDIYDIKYKEYLLEKDKINRLISNYALNNTNIEISLEYLLKLACNAFYLFKSSGIDKKRKLIKLVFPNLYLNGQNIDYIMRKPFDMLVKGLNCSQILGRKDSNLRNAWTKTRCLTTWRRPIRQLL